MAIKHFTDNDSYCICCDKKNGYKDYVTFKCNHDIHIFCLNQLFAMNQQKSTICVQRDELCFDKMERIFPNKKLMTIDYVDSYSDYAVQCPNHQSIWSHENTYYILKNQSLVGINFVIMMLAGPDNDKEIYHQICTKYDIVHYMSIEKQIEYFMLNDESKFNIGPIDYTVYFMIKEKEFINHLVIKHTKKCGRIIIYPESKCPACLRPQNLRFKHATLIEYLKLCSESTAKIQKLNTIDSNDTQ